MKVSKILARVGLCFMIAGQLLFYYLFTLAYFTKSKSLPFSYFFINEYGEAHIEMILNIIGFILIFFVIKNEMRDD